MKAMRDMPIADDRNEDFRMLHVVGYINARNGHETQARIFQLGCDQTREFPLQFVIDTFAPLLFHETCIGSGATNSLV